MTDMPERILIGPARAYDLGLMVRAEAKEDTTPYTRSDLVPTWNGDLSAARAWGRVLLATEGGRVGEAWPPMEEYGEWVWADTGRAPHRTPIAWMPLPKHPDEAPAAGSDKGGGG